MLHATNRTSPTPLAARHERLGPRRSRRPIAVAAWTGVLGLAVATVAWPAFGQGAGGGGRPLPGAQPAPPRDPFAPPGRSGGGSALPGQPNDPGRSGVPSLPPLPQPGAAEPPANQRDAGPQAAELEDARRALAERLVMDAQGDLQHYVPSDALWRKAAAEIDAAVRLNPDEPRYSRLLAEAWSEVGDADQAIKALATYRATLGRLKQPDDQVAQCRLIDLYLGRMQTNEQKIEYLVVNVVARESLAAEVRSYAATQAIPVLLERSEQDAIAMTRRAVELNPLNPQARQWEWELIASRGTPAEQFDSMLAMIRCNPTQLPTMISVGERLAGMGLSNECLDWFGRARDLAIRTRTPLGADVALEFATQLYRTGPETHLHYNFLITDVLQQQPDNVEAWFMALSVHGGGNGGIARDQELAQVKKVLLDAESRAARGVADAAAAGQGTASPGGAGAPPIEETIRDLQQAGKVPLPQRDAFISTAVDLAWFELFYDRVPDEAARWLDALKALLPANDVTLLRLQGWHALISKDLANARARLAPVQDRDALAALGMVFVLQGEAASGAGAAAAPSAPAARVPTTLSATAAPAPQAAPRSAAPVAAAVAAAPGARAPATRPAAPPPPPAPAAAPTTPAAKLAQADALAKRLLTYNPTGLLGMTLCAALQDRKISPDPLPDAAPLKDSLAKFPRDFLRIGEEPSATGGPNKFYIVSGKPLKVPSKLGEPMLAEISIQNNGVYPIAVGPGGTIRRDLWFDGRASLAEARTYPMTGYDTIANVLVLQPRAVSKQIVRVDQGALADVVTEKPAASINVFITLMTNPLAVANTSVIAGPAGVRQQLSRSFIRAGAPLTDEGRKKQVFQGLKGLPSEKMQTADLLAAYLRQARGKTADGRVLALAPELREQLDKLRTDGVPEVAAWAARLLAPLAEGGERNAMIEPLVSSPQWDVRLLALAISDLLEPAAHKRVATDLAKDPDPGVQAMAQAELDLVARPPALRPNPTTQPAGGGNDGPPTTGPATTPGSPAGPALPGTPAASGAGGASEGPRLP